MVFFTIILPRFHAAWAVRAAAYLKPSTMVGILFLFQILLTFFCRNSNNILMMILFDSLATFTLQKNNKFLNYSLFTALQCTGSPRLVRFQLVRSPV